MRLGGPAHFGSHDVLTSKALGRCGTLLRSSLSPAIPFLRDAHPTSLALMRTEGQRAVRFALSGAEDIYARRWRTVAESGSIVGCAEGVFDKEVQNNPIYFSNS